jgi:hypothetical protein
MTSASQRRTGQIDGPRGRRFVEVEDWARLPEGWSFCDVPGVTVGPDDRVYLFNRGNCPRSADHPIIVLEPDGTFVRSFGEGYFTFAHAIAMGVDGLLYCVDVGEVRQAAGADAAGWHKAVRKLARIA